MKIKEFVKKNKVTIGIIAIAVASFYVGRDVGVRGTCSLIREHLTEQELVDLIKTLKE